jgi:hypothetical protein
MEALTWPLGSGSAGPIRDLAIQLTEDWLRQLETAVRDAQADGATDPSEDAAQLAFEIEAALLLANAQYVVARTHEPIERAQRAIERRLTSVTTSSKRRSRSSRAAPSSSPRRS